MTIWINDAQFDRITEFAAERETRRTDVRYNTRGDMLIDLVGRKYRLTVRFGLLTSAELAKLRKLTQEIFVRVKFPAPEGEQADGGYVTEEFHISDEPAPVVTRVNGVTMYGGVELVMKQK